MKTLSAALIVVTTLLSGLAQAEICIVHVSDPAKGATPQILTSSKIVTLAYDPQNQIEDGDTIFMGAQISTDVALVRESHFMDGSPELALVDVKTKKELKRTSLNAQKDRPAGSFATIDLAYKNQIIQVACE